MLIMKTASAIRSRFRFWIRAALALTVVSGAAARPEVPSGIDHGPWDELLGKYVDEKGLVDYRGWHSNKEDLRALDDYLAQFAPAPETPASGDEKIASLINAYNAFTIQTVLKNFPTESIRKLDDPFDGERHRVGGELVSLDHIEHRMLRPMIGWKVHSVVVCAARSCPPLLDEAYFPDTWEEQMKERYRTWLARGDLNEYDTGGFGNTVEISKIFDWYDKDFKGNNSIQNVLRRFGPEEYKDFFAEGFRTRHKKYHWGLNAQSDLGKDYSHNILRSIF